MKNYKNFKEITNGNERHNKYRVILYLLGRKRCEEILQQFYKLDRLIVAYQKDVFLNNLCKENSQNLMSLPWRFQHCGGAWEWDMMGYKMLTGLVNRRVHFSVYSLCDLTCLAKECAYHLIRKELAKRNVTKN